MIHTVQADSNTYQNHVYTVNQSGWSKSL